jgi:hypothetical protein
MLVGRMAKILNSRHPPTSDELMSGDSFLRHSTTSVIKKWRKQIRPEVRTSANLAIRSLVLLAAPTTLHWNYFERVTITD